MRGVLAPTSNPFHLVLVSPQSPPNTGNVARLCAVTGCKLELVEPLGFSIGDKELKRAGLDYWDKVFLKLHPTYPAYLAAHPQAPGGAPDRGKGKGGDCCGVTQATAPVAEDKNQDRNTRK